MMAPACSKEAVIGNWRPSTIRPIPSNRYTIIRSPAAPEGPGGPEVKQKLKRARARADERMDDGRWMMDDGGCWLLVAGLMGHNMGNMADRISHIACIVRRSKCLVARKGPVCHG